MNDFLHTLLGAALVVLGVIVGGLADRIRGLRAQHRAERAQPRVIEAQSRARKSTPREVPTTTAHEAMARDVVLVLTTTGYDRETALAAVAACAGSETSTIESWTKAALRRCMKEKQA